MGRTNFSDEELVAYLDNEGEYAPIDEINAALLVDADLAKRLDALRVDTNKIAGGLSACLVKSKKPNFDLAAPVQRRWAMPAIAASLLVVLFAFGGGQYWRLSEERQWKDYVAAYQFLYTTNTLSSVQNSDIVKQQELDRVGAAIGKKILVSQVAEFPEVEYKRAQLLGYKGKALIQLTFLSSTGKPIALCILRTSSRENKDVEFSELEGMSAASWKSEDYDYLLIGGQDEMLIERMSKIFTANKI